MSRSRARWPAATTGEPLVSVSLPYFDCRDRLPTALASLLAQTHETWECLFVDDGSSDRPQEVLEQFADPRIRTFRLPQNAGRGTARQLALERARGDYHAMLDADDWLYPQRLASQLELFRRVPELRLVGAGIAVVDSADRLVGVRRQGCRPPEPRIRGPAAAQETGEDPSAVEGGSLVAPPTGEDDDELSRPPVKWEARPPATRSRATTARSSSARNPAYPSSSESSSTPPSGIGRQ